MNIKCKLFFILILTTSIFSNTFFHHQPTNSTGDEKRYVISGLAAGFFASFLAMLNHFLYAERNNLIPVVFWGPKFAYYEPGVPNGNAWEYYFEPVSHLTYQPGEKIHNEFHNEEKWVPASWNKLVPIYWSPNGYQLPFNTPTMFNQDIRDLCHGLITCYIRLKPRIQNKIDAFYEANIQGKKTIGIHLRGSDKHNEVGYVDHLKMLTKANEVARQLGPNTQFFIATDEQRLLNLAKAHLNGTVLYQDTIKTESFNNMSHYQAIAYHQTGNVSKLTLGEEVLTDVLILAKCDALVHSLSLVSQCAAYFNPHMPCYLVTRQPKRNLINYSMHLINTCLQGLFKL